MGKTQKKNLAEFYSRRKFIMFSSIGPAMEQLCVNKSHIGSWCEFFKKRDQAKTTSLKLYFSKFFCGQSNKRNFSIFYNTGKIPLGASM